MRLRYSNVALTRFSSVGLFWALLRINFETSGCSIFKRRDRLIVASMLAKELLMRLSLL